MKIKDNKPSEKKAFKKHILKEYKKSYDSYNDGPYSFVIKSIIKYDGEKEYYTFDFLFNAPSNYTPEFLELCALYPNEYDCNKYKQYSVNVFAENSDYIGGGEFEQEIEADNLDKLIDIIFDVEYYGYFVGFGYMLID